MMTRRETEIWIGSGLVQVFSGGFRICENELI